MKFPLLLLSFFLLHSASAQDPAQLANQVRKVVAGDILSYAIAPTPLLRVEYRWVKRGADSVRIRLYRPYEKVGPLPVIYQIHGGALVAGDLDTHDNICRLLSARTSSIVIAVDYRRPPETPFPAGLDDCAAVLDWIRAEAASWGGDASKLSLVGDSGGGLLATALGVRNAGRIPIRRMVLINPAVDLRQPGEGLYGMVTKMYLNGRSANDSLVSPALASNLSFFPPTLIVTCEKDQLKPHGLVWHEKLRAAKVPSTVVELPGEDHLGGFWAAGHPRAQKAVDESIAFLRATPAKKKEKDRTKSK